MGDAGIDRLPDFQFDCDNVDQLHHTYYRNEHFGIDGFNMFWSLETLSSLEVIVCIVFQK